MMPVSTDRQNVLLGAGLGGLVALPLLRIGGLSWFHLLIMFIAAVLYVWLLFRFKVDIGQEALNGPSSSWLRWLPPIHILFLFYFIFLSIPDPVMTPRSGSASIIVPGLLVLLASILLMGLGRFGRSDINVPNSSNRKDDRSRSLSLVDLWVLIIGVGLVLSSLVAKMLLFPVDPGWKHYIGEIKIISCLVLWFLLKNRWNVLKPETEAPNLRLPGWLGIGILTVLVAHILFGGITMARVVHHFREGNRIFGLERWQEAREQYEEMLHLNRHVRIPGVGSEAAHRMGVLSLRQGGKRIDEQLFKLLHDSYRDSLALREAVGDIYFEAGRWKRAERIYFDIQWKGKRKNQLAGKRARCLIRMEAFHDLTRLAATFKGKIDLEEDDYLALLGLGQAFVYSGKYEKAMPSLNAAVRLDSTRYEPNFWIGIAYQGMRHWKESQVPLETAIIRDPFVAESYYYLGLAKEMQGQIEDAVTDYLRALHVQPDHANSLTALEQLYSIMGRIDDAAHVAKQDHILFDENWSGSRNPFGKDEILLQPGQSVSKRIRSIDGLLYVDIDASVRIPGKTEDSIDPNALAIMTVSMDGVVIGTVKVSPGTTSIFSVSTHTLSGQRILTVEHERSEEKSRGQATWNLSVERIEIRHQAFDWDSL